MFKKYLHKSDHQTEVCTLYHIHIPKYQVYWYTTDHNLHYPLYTRQHLPMKRRKLYIDLMQGSKRRSWRIYFLLYSHSTDKEKGLCSAFLKILNFTFLIIKFWIDFKTRVVIILSVLPGVFVLVKTKKLNNLLLYVYRYFFVSSHVWIFIDKYYT